MLYQLNEKNRNTYRQKYRFAYYDIDRYKYVQMDKRQVLYKNPEVFLKYFLWYWSFSQFDLYPIP